MEKTEVKSSRGTKPLLIGVGVAVMVVVVGCTAFTALYINKVDDKLDWVSYNGHFGESPALMNEEMEVDAGRQIILHMNGDGMKAGINNSMTLHDYNTGLRATKVFGQNTECHIQDLEETFDEALDMVNRYRETGDTGSRPIINRESGDFIPQDQLSGEIGEELAHFCRGIPTYRLGEVIDTTRSARGVSASCCCCCHCCCHCRAALDVQAPRF